MNIEDIKQLVELMVANDLSELDIANGENKVSLKRAKPVPAAAPSIVPALPGVAAPAPTVGASVSAPASDLIEIRSPMVGTYYSAPSPDSEAFVKVGASISDETVVCIVEAMKVMNEIKAEISGAIAEVCVRNAQPVEYGQVLFRVKPE